MGALRLQRFAEADAFLAAAGPFLVEREAEHNLIFGVSSTLHDDPGQYAAPPYLATVRDGDRVVAAALQTPPFRLVLSEVDDPAALGLIVADTLERDLPGVQGPVDVVRAFVEEWRARGGPQAHHHLASRIYRLSEIIPPRPVPGGMRDPAPGDRDVLVEWMWAFGVEALGDDDRAGAAEAVDRWMAGRGRILHVWQDGDEIVSVCGVTGPTPHGIRVGPVYTPPEQRGRGYASALVAAVSRAQLDAGRRFVFLFTDLANPTSNRIYQAIGYEPVRDVDEYEFERG
jgi:uncharacterized protein